MEFFDFLSEFCCWKIKQIAKIGLRRKNQLSPQFFHTWANGTSYTRKQKISYIGQSLWQPINSKQWPTNWCGQLTKRPSFYFPKCFDTLSILCKFIRVESLSTHTCKRLTCWVHFHTQMQKGWRHLKFGWHTILFHPWELL
jgi:hypothetical protein